MIQFRLVYFFLKAFSLLPFKALYVLAGVIRFLLERVFSYRKTVVMDNIRHAFPEYSPEERKRVAREFYRHFSDTIVEEVKYLSMSKGELAKRISFSNPEILNRYYSEGKSIVAIAAHFGNWEWLTGVTGEIKHKTIGVYKPLNNIHFDNFMRKHRSKFGTEMVTMREVIRVLLSYSSLNVPTMSLFIADQSPVWEEIQYWTEFLNQPSAVYLGPEKIASRYGMAVVFLRIKRPSRGYYQVEIVPISEDASKEKNYLVTDKHVKVLEDTIRERPELWLWSHRRWKLTRKREKEEAIGKYRFKGKFRKRNDAEMKD